MGQQRSQLAVVWRRTERTITRLLWGASTAAVAVLMVILEMGDLLDVPFLGNVVLAVGALALVVLVVLGLPYLLIRAGRTLAFRGMVRGQRAEFAQWAEHRELKALEAGPGGAQGVLSDLLAHARELDLPLQASVPEKVRFSDVITGRHQGHDTVLAAARGLAAPIFTARFVAIRAEHEVPALSITDRHSDELWVSPQQRFESGRFNERWRVIAKDPRYASAMVHNQVMEALVGAPLDLDRIDFTSGWLVSWVSPDATPAAVDGHLELLSRLADDIPRFVLRDYA